MADLQKLVDELSKLTVLEAAELSKKLEEAWGVSAAAPVAVAAAGVVVGRLAAVGRAQRRPGRRVDAVERAGQALEGRIDVDDRHVRPRRIADDDRQRRVGLDGALQPSGVYRMMKRYAKRVGITVERFGPQAARATAATNALDQGADIANEIRGNGFRTSLETRDGPG